MPGILELPSASTPICRDYLSYSAIKTYQGCPLRYFFRYIQGLPETTIAASLLFGAAFHTALEAHYHALLVGDEVPGVDGLLEAFWGAWNARQVEDIRFAKGDTLDSLGAMADRMFRAFLSSELATPKGVILGIEEELRGTLLEGLPDLLARVDLIVETDDALILSDFKTSRTSWDDNKVANSADQLLLYSDLVKTLAGDKPLRLEFAVFTKTKTPSVTIHPVDYDSRQVERTKRIIERVWGAIANEHFYPNPSHHCATCSFRKPCRDWQG